MSINYSNDNSNGKVENSYDFESPMYCPYCSMPYTGPIQDEYIDVDPYDEDFNHGYRHRGRRRRRRHRRRHRRRCRRNICEFPFFPLFYNYDDWYWY